MRGRENQGGQTCSICFFHKNGGVWRGKHPWAVCSAKQYKWGLKWVQIIHYRSHRNVQTNFQLNSCQIDSPDSKVYNIVLDLKMHPFISFLFLSFSYKPKSPELPLLTHLTQLVEGNNTNGRVWLLRPVEIYNVSRVCPGVSSWWDLQGTPHPKGAQEAVKNCTLGAPSLPWCTSHRILQGTRSNAFSQSTKYI